MLNKSLVESMKVGDSKDLCVIRYPFLGMETGVQPAYDISMAAVVGMPQMALSVSHLDGKCGNPLGD
jgi:hypothetical protein